MKKETLVAVKADLKKLLVPVGKLTNLWGDSFPVLQTVEVLLSNMCFDGSNCDGYSFEKAIEELLEAEQVIASIAEYEDFHAMSWINGNIGITIRGHIMNEEQDI